MFDWWKIRLEAVLGISGVLMLAGSLAPWETFSGGISGNALRAWQGNVVFVGSWLIVIGALARYGVLLELQRYRPYTDAFLGGIGGMLGLVGAFSFPLDMSPGASLGWGFYLVVIVSFVALFSSFMIYWEHERRGLPRGGLASSS